MDILVCTCGTTYKQTGSQITGLTIEIMRNGEGKFSRFATFATQESWSPAIYSEVAANIAFAIFRRRYTGGRGIDLEAYTYVRGRVHLFTNAQPRIPISKGYILDRHPSVLAQDNRDKWSVIRRSLKRGHSYELPEPAVSKIDFQLRGFGIPLRLLRPLQSLDSLWTQRGRR